MISVKNDYSSPEESDDTYASSKKSPGFLSSVFNGSGNHNLFQQNGEHKVWTSPKKSQGFFSSVLSTNNGIFTGISSKLEAALNLSFEVLDSDSSSKSNEVSQRNSPSYEYSSSSSDVRKSSLPILKSENVTKHQHYKKRRAHSARQKDRSVYGQPEIDISADQKAHAIREPSQDSLDTIDSGQSLGNSSINFADSDGTNKHDPFFVFRHTESVGIGSESDIYGQSTSLDSSDAESIPEGGIGIGRSGSGCSLQSWESSASCESESDEFSSEAMKFMKIFVGKIFENCSDITFEEKAQYGKYCQQEHGRLWFSRFVNTQRCQNKQVKESTFYSLVQYFAIVLFECAEADDFSPAKSLMNMCFTFYHEVHQEGQPVERIYLYMYLKDQPIWHTLRFWNAAFFDAVQCERAHRSIPTRDDLDHYSTDDMRDERSFQENITFGQLGTFTYNMHAFGLSKKFCLEFLRKQCTIASLPKEHVSLLRENVERLYVERDR